MGKISGEFEFRPDRTTDYGITCSCPLASKNFPCRLIMGKWCLHASSFIFDRIIIKVAGNQDRHKNSDVRFRASGFHGPFICFLKWDLTLAHWTQVSDRCPLGMKTFTNC